LLDKVIVLSYEEKPTVAVIFEEARAE
jgi:hypothetical protein